MNIADVHPILFSLIPTHTNPNIAHVRNRKVTQKEMYSDSG